MRAYNPQAKSEGKISKEIVELLDLYPTLAKLAGLTAPSTIDGKSLTSLLDQSVKKWSKPAFTQLQRGHMPGHSVRTNNWRYTEWNYGELGTELYDERIDHKELNHLVKNTRYKKIVDELKALLYRNHPQKMQQGVAAPDTKKKYSD